MLDSPRKAYLTVMAITAVNPATVVYFVALVVGSPMGDIDGVGIAVAFVLGVGLASAAWQLLIAGGGAVLGRVLSGEAAHRWTSIVGGLVVLALAVRTALGA
jgi:threonine/homoserine/homoserine lactone efflux protein